MSSTPCKVKLKVSLICIALYYELLVSKALRFGMCKQGITPFFLPPTSNFIMTKNKLLSYSSAVGEIICDLSAESAISALCICELTYN